MTARRPRRTGAWSSPELDYLRRWFGQRPVAVIARRLHRSEASVRARAKTLFAGRRRRLPGWSAADDARLREGVGVVPQAELALALRRTLVDVRARVRQLRAQCTARPWTAGDETLLKRVYGQRSGVALEVCCQRPGADIEAAAARLCLRKDRRFSTRATPRWTADDVVRLRALYPMRDNLDVARTIGRSVPSIANKANQLGLKKRKRWLRQTGRQSAARRWRKR